MSKIYMKLKYHVQLKEMRLVCTVPILVIIFTQIIICESSCFCSKSKSATNRCKFEKESKPPTSSHSSSSQKPLSNSKSLEFGASLETDTCNACLPSDRYHPIFQHIISLVKEVQKMFEGKDPAADKDVLTFVEQRKLSQLSNSIRNQLNAFQLLQSLEKKMPNINTMPSIAAQVNGVLYAVRRAAMKANDFFLFMVNPDTGRATVDDMLKLCSALLSDFQDTSVLGLFSRLKEALNIADILADMGKLVENTGGANVV